MLCQIAIIWRCTRNEILFVIDKHQSDFSMTNFLSFRRSFTFVILISCLWTVRIVCLNMNVYRLKVLTKCVLWMWIYWFGKLQSPFWKVDCIQMNITESNGTFRSHSQIIRLIKFLFMFVNGINFADFWVFLTSLTLESTRKLKQPSAIHMSFVPNKSSGGTYNEMTTVECSMTMVKRETVSFCHINCDIYTLDTVQWLTYFA